MAAIKFKSALGVERMYEEGFGGIDHTKSKGSCHLAENLDKCADGSMKTRAGYTAAVEHEGSLRASFNHASKLYTVAGDIFTVTRVESGTREIEAKLANSEGCADIFCFGGDIYIHDGIGLYRLKNHSIASVEGYAPLYGKGWDPTILGEINEDINILSDRIRISYSLKETTADFYLGINASSIDRVELNGKRILEDPYEIKLDEANPSIIHTIGMMGGNTLTFWLTLSPEESQKHRIQQPTKAFVFGNNGGERLCLYNHGISCNLYSSIPISQSDQALSALTAAGALPLYIPASSALCIGSGTSPVTGLAHHYGRGILFTESDAWFVDWNDKENDPSIKKPQCFLLNSAIGADHIQSSAYFDNDPITYFCGRLWRWHSGSNVRDECSASIISDEVAELIPADSERISMLSLPQMQKIFISDAEDEKGRLLVYDLARSAWTLYSGIYAERLLRYGNLPAFSRGGCIYVFKPDFAEDQEPDEVFPIRSKLVTHFLDFDCPEKVKRSATVLIEYDLLGGAATLTLENEKGEKTVSILRGKTDGGREQFSEHIRLPRFKKLRLTLETGSPAVIYNAIISVK
jgi:hypothetical protein